MRQDFIARVESAPTCVECFTHQQISNNGELLRPIPPLRNESLPMLSSIPEDVAESTRLAIQAPPPVRRSNLPLSLALVDITTSLPEDLITNNVVARRRTRFRRPSAESDRTTFTDPTASTGGAGGAHLVLSQSPISSQKVDNRESGEPTNLES